MTGRRKLILTTIPLIFYLVAAAELLAGKNTASLVWLVIGIVIQLATIVLDWRLSRVAQPLTLAPDQAAEVLAERDRAGEVAATKHLRAKHPQLSLQDALRMVREL